MSTLSGLISAGGGGTLFTIPVTKSVTFTPPFNGTAVIHCIGGGASGGTDGQQQNCTGGGAGGYSRKIVTLSTGTNLTLVVGAGGSPVRNSSDGNDGGNTTATDGSFTLTANGGDKGLTNSTTAGAGGTASGGDVNNTGGAGGGGSTMGGGGAVGILGTGNAGAAATHNNNNANNIYYGGDSDVQSPQFENTNGELRGGGRGGRFFYREIGSSPVEINGGFLAGGGAGFTISAGHNVFGGDGGIGGGGGTANYTAVSSEGMVNSGAGGAGLILIMYTAIT